MDHHFILSFSLLSQPKKKPHISKDTHTKLKRLVVFSDTQSGIKFSLVHPDI